MSSLCLIDGLLSSFNINRNDALSHWFQQNINNALEYKQLELLSVDNTQLPQNNKEPRQLSNTCYTKVNPTSLPSPVLISHSAKCIQQCLNIKINDKIMHIVTKIVSGDMETINKYIPKCSPFSHRYAGKQAGLFAGQLGDGRAISLGVINGYELQLKGSGKTPFSRFGDGRAVLFSSIREFLASEAMYYLNVSTSRGAVLIASHEYEVIRKHHIEPTAILLRLSKGFIRFGSFETCYIDETYNHLIDLIDYVIKYHYNDIVDDNDKYELFWKEIVDRTIRMNVAWKCVGFVHGVLNTDNMSIIGETMDYGPYGFMEYFDENFIPNHTDWNGLYSWFSQQSVIKWNLQQLALALDKIGVLPIKISLKYLGNIGDDDSKDEVTDCNCNNDEFPFKATMNREHFDEFIAENCHKIKEKTHFVKDLRDKRGLNMLHYAVIHDCAELISVLVSQYGVDVNEVDINGYSPLFYAVNQKNEECLANLLLFKPKIDSITKDCMIKVTVFPIYICGGQTIIHQAAETNSLKCCALILDYMKRYMDSNQWRQILFHKDFNDYTAMDLAKMENNKPEILLLLNSFIRKNMDYQGILNDDVYDESMREEMKREYHLAVRDRVLNKEKSQYLQRNNEDDDIETYDALFERYYMIELRKKFGFLGENDMEKVMEIRKILFHTLQRTCCDYTNAFRNLNMFSIFGVNKYDESGNTNVDHCMKEEDDEYLEYIVSQCATIEQYKTLGYRPRLQSKIILFETMIKNNTKYEDLTMDEMKELVMKLKSASVIMYGDDGDLDVNDLMNRKIEDLKNEEQKRKRDKILWIRFIKKYRKFVNDERSFDETSVDSLRKLNAQRIYAMDNANPKYILRNYLMEQAIQMAKKRDYSMVHELLNMVENPFTTQKQADINDYTAPAPLESCDIYVSCAS